MVLIQRRFGGRFRDALLVTGACLLGIIQAQWVQPPTEAVRQQTPGLMHRVLESRFMKTRVGYCVVLPRDYDLGDRRYPVIYWLHGGGGNESSSLFTARAWRELEREIDPVILVYPNGFRSGYMDHADGKVMVESMIIQELIPGIDREFRTVATREGRAVHGFSMGSSGSLKFAFKYPDLFAAAVGYGGGAIDYRITTDPWLLNILQRNLNSDPELVSQHNTYHFLEVNGERVRREGSRFLLICGSTDSWMESARVFHASLVRNQISSELVVVPEVGHRLKELIEAEGKRAARFQHEVFRESLALSNPSLR